MTDSVDLAAASRLLDDPTRHARLDPGGMHAAIGALPSQLREAPRLVEQVKWTSFKPTTPAGVCLCGMGGSAIGGDLARQYWEYESPVPFVIVRNDRLPDFINRFWLVIASSYSGNTEETLNATAEAKSRGCRILAMTTGGKLQKLAAQEGWPLIILPGGLAPRAALGFSFGPVMLALARWGIVPDRTDLLIAAADFLENRAELLSAARPLATNPAKQAAALLPGRIVVVYGSAGSTDIPAYRFKSQLCENSKVPAFANVIPELLHNELVPMDLIGPERGIAAVVLQSEDDGTRACARREWVAARFKARGIPLLTLSAFGANRLARMLSLAQLGDYTSYHLAILTGQDPMPVPAIVDLKAQMSAAPG